MNVRATIRAAVAAACVAGGWLGAVSPWLGLAAGEPRALDAIYPGLEELRKGNRDVVCLLDVEHPEEVRARLHSLERVRLCIELETAGLPCLLVHASLVRAGDLASPRVKAVVVCGRNRAMETEPERRVRDLLRECPAPLLCSGGGLGLLAPAWGGRTGPMRRLGPGEADPAPSYLPGSFKETGFTPVAILDADPVFAGLGGTAVVMERHGLEVKEVPPGFEVLASTPDCRVQAIRPRDPGRLIYGFQFQPDRFNELHCDGRRILTNFFRLAGIDPDRRVPEARAVFRARARELVRNVCREPRELLEQTGPHVALVDLEAPEAVASPRKGSGGLTHAEKIERLRSRIAGELAGMPCVVVHYMEAQKEHFAHPQLRAIVISGAGNPTADPMARDLFAVIREGRVAILGLCAGHQHIAEAHGVESGPMRRLRQGEEDPWPAYHPGMFKEWGFLPVTVTRPDPLFAGLANSFMVREQHVAESKAVPAGFDLLASTADCEVQAMKQRGKLVYGTQFHPEAYDDEHPDGRRILQNFFRMAAGSDPASGPAQP